MPRLFLRGSAISRLPPCYPGWRSAIGPLRGRVGCWTRPGCVLPLGCPRPDCRRRRLKLWQLGSPARHGGHWRLSTALRTSCSIQSQRRQAGPCAMVRTPCSNRCAPRRNECAIQRDSRLRWRAHGGPNVMALPLKEIQAQWTAAEGRWAYLVLLPGVMSAGEWRAVGTMFPGPWIRVWQTD